MATGFVRASWYVAASKAARCVGGSLDASDVGSGRFLVGKLSIDPGDLVERRLRLPPVRAGGVDVRGDDAVAGPVEVMGRVGARRLVRFDELEHERAVDAGAGVCGELVGR
jgi:hypothetical protein